jgi:hypothetical protein
MGDRRFQLEKAFLGTHWLKNFGRSRLYMAQFIAFMRPLDRKKIVAIAPVVLPPQYGEVAAFAFSLFYFFIFLMSFTGRTGRPILAFDGSNNAVRPQEVPLGVAVPTNFIKVLLPPPEFPIGLAAWEMKNA